MRSDATPSARVASAASGGVLVAPGLRIAPAGPASRAVLRLDAAMRVEAAVRSGWPLDAPLLRARRDGDRTALRLGPDEWLLLQQSAAADLEALAARLPAPHSLVDVSERQVGFEFEGPLSAAALAVGCPLDLRTHAFAIDTATRTVFGKAEVTLWRTGEQAYRVECWRSFAPYLSARFAASLGDLAGD